MKKYQLDLEVEDNRMVGPGVTLLTLRNDKGLPDMVGGQFAEIQVPSARVLLRRPVSIHSIDKEKSTMLTEAVGADLSRMNSEMNKLVIAMPQEKTEITPEFIEERVGISKDFNIFEFKDALVNKDVLKANRIAAYYESNPKMYPMQLVTAAIFPFFANLMLAFYSPDKTDAGIACHSV